MFGYNFKAIDKSGRLITGVLAAESVVELREKIQARQHFLVSFSEGKPLEADEHSRAHPSGFFRGVSDRELALLAWQIHAMLSAGLQVMRSLEVLARQCPNPRLKLALEDVSDSLAKGADFSTALSRQRRVFPPIFSAMVETGEMAGNLDVTMERLARYLDRSCELREKVISAAAYPAMLLGLSASVSLFLLVFILPKMATVFADAGVPLPAVTRALMATGTFMRVHWLAFVGAAVALVAGVFLAHRTERGRYAIESTLLEVPFLGTVLVKNLMARLTQTLAMLWTSGVPITASLLVLERNIDNTVAERLIRNMQVGVAAGKPLSRELCASPFVPELVATMVSVGEETGGLGEMLERVAIVYQKEVDFSVAAFARVMEPVLLVVMTVIVGVIAASVYLPVADLATTLGR